MLNSNGRYYSLDGLRGLAIIIVLGSHFNHLLHIPLFDYIFAAGIAGVYIFFVLSGFLITSLLYKEHKKNSSINLKKFYARRVLRIFPLAFLYILTVFILSYLISEPQLRVNVWIPILYMVNISGLGLVHYVFLHFWSLSVEEQFYIFIPVILNYFFKTLIYWAIGLLLSTFLFRALHLIYPSSPLINLLHDLTRNLDGLLIGTILSVFFHENKIPITGLLYYRKLLSPILLILILILNHEFSNTWMKLVANHTFYSLLIGCLIVINIHPANDWFFKILNSKILVRVGIISYSIYIWQQLFSSSLFKINPFLNITLTFAVAFLSYRYVETPFLKIKNKFKLV